MIRMHVADISVYGRATQGVRLMRVPDGARVISVACAERAEENGTEAKDEEG
jgi:DNA gyrase subunit A